MARGDVAEKIDKILNTPKLRCETSAAVLEALDLYVDKNVDFIDAYQGIVLRGAEDVRVVTYDRKHFTRMESLTVVEP